MRLYYSSYLFALCLSISACSPSTEEIKTILNAHIAGLGEEGSTMVTNVEKTEKHIYSGTFSVSKDTLTAFVYPFTAIVKKDQVTQFFKDTDEAKVKVVNKHTGEEETKAAYDERIKKEEEEKRAAEKAKKAAAAASARRANAISFPMTINFPGSQYAYTQNNWNATFYFYADGSVRENWGTYTNDAYWSDWSGGNNGKLLVTKNNKSSQYWCFSFTEQKVYYGYSNFRSKTDGVPFRKL